MKNLLSSLFKSAEERVSHPFISSFIISYVLFNWDIFLYLIFSSKSIESRIYTIKSNMVEAGDFIYPLLFALFYILGLQYLGNLFDWISTPSKKIKQNREKRDLIRIRELKKEETKFELEMEELKIEKREKSDINSKVPDLLEQLENKDNEIKLTKQRLNELEVEIALKERDELESGFQDMDKASLGLTREYQQFKELAVFKQFGAVGRSIIKSGVFPVTMDSMVIEKYKYLDIIKPIKNIDGSIIKHRFTQKGEFFWRNYVLEKDLND